MGSESLKSNVPAEEVSPTYTVTPPPIAPPTIHQSPTFNIPPTATLVLYSPYTPTPFVFIPPDTATPVPPELCPKSNDFSKHLDIGPISETFDQSYELPILDFLNNGGSIDLLNRKLKNLVYWFDIQYIDLTNDTAPEIVIYANRLYIFTCVNGKYAASLVVNPLPIENYGPTLKIKDMNLDGIPELIISRTYGGQTPSMQIEILEWDGKEFQSLLAKDNVCSRHFSIYACIYDGVPDILGGDAKLIDIDNNGTIELLISGGSSIVGGDAVLYHPTRFENMVWQWNGKEFILSSMKLSPPDYRFQALEDGDEASISGDYEKALASYWQAINDDKLHWWSPSIREYNMNSFGNQTPIATPTIDLDEYPRLAAYAYYRIMLIYVLKEQFADAQKVYDILQTKFSKNEQAYIGLASTFWNEYNASHEMGNACLQTIKYAENHSDEIIKKLGVDYYNLLSNQIYQPNDICPFR